MQQNAQPVAENNTLEQAEKQRRMERWRLLLGARSEDSFIEKHHVSACLMSEQAKLLENTLAAIYDESGQNSDANSKRGGRNSQSPINLSKWLGDVRQLFPKDIVSIIQQDAIERKGLTKLIFEPENLATITPDIKLVSTLLAFKDQIPEQSKDAARLLVQAIVDQIMARMENALRRAVTGALNKRQHSPISQLSAIDWKRTIQRNLKNYDPESKRLLAEKFYFFERTKRQKAWHVIVDIDQSGSMCESILYSSVMASVFASMPSLETSVVAFDTNVVDLTEMCRTDPVDMLFGLQLGGGTDINRSVEYCQSLITQPRKTLFILISDLYEGGVEKGLLRRLEAMKDDGVTVVTLLALADSGRPSYDEVLGKKISKLGIPCFACTPDRLPDLIERAMKGLDLNDFAKSQSAQ